MKLFLRFLSCTYVNHLYLSLQTHHLLPLHLHLNLYSHPYILIYRLREMLLESVMSCGCNRCITHGGINSRLKSRFSRMRRKRIIGDGTKRET
jgi:hypothetical protein